jgi:predicted nucleic acid-binding protein
LRFAVDSNILVYAFVRDDPDKHYVASEIMIRAMTLDAVLTAQSLGEFLNVIRRKHIASFDVALTQVERWASTIPTLVTSADAVIGAAALARRHRLQLWDSIIWEVARGAGASCFLSEDLQDGLAIDGMTALNPFNPANAPRLAELLTPAPGTG